MAAAVTFAFTMPCLPTEQMQQEKFGEAHTCVWKSLLRGEKKGKICGGANAGIWENDRLSIGAQVPECMFLNMIAHNLVYFEDYVVLASCLGIKHHQNNDIQVKSETKI